MKDIEFISFIDPKYYEYTLGVVNTVYLHGQLEAQVGYDCCSVSKINPKYLKILKDAKGITNSFLNLNGIFEVSVKGVDKPCIGYFWVADTSKYFVNQRGIIVFKDDKEANEYALKKYDEKSIII
ncbi:MAG: hypothetical protein [Wendovervirus sonii]|uniref:Uncharacterized protein n=1 Tax=phage Lak_Megaphage_Sonny TaxID=3109229 RepID=A0ABZ0Z378_9CAUD|nr:MAG: hypothetical protein [phage Lak_Megaphage_Sonny]